VRDRSVVFQYQGKSFSLRPWADVRFHGVGDIARDGFLHENAVSHDSNFSNDAKIKNAYRFRGLQGGVAVPHNLEVVDQSLAFRRQ
jgi:hypothetical protein